MIRARRRTAGRTSSATGQHGGQQDWTGPGPDERDPHPVGEMLENYVADRGWQRPLSEARVFTNWADIVGAEVASHCRPVHLREGELRVSAESTAWATQLRMLGASLLARVAADVGAEVVTRIVVAGPTGPTWKHGGRSVRGARGPRDTYG